MYPLKVVLIGCNEYGGGTTGNLSTQVRRELANLLAYVQSEFRDVPAAIKNIQIPKDEHLLFLYHLRTLEDLAALERLSKAFPGQPILALRGGGTDNQLFLGALKAGATFAIPVPLSADDFKTALEWISKQFGYEPRFTPVIAVAGVTGGTGASTVAVNLAYEIANLGRHCVLVELALRLGVLATHMNAEPRFHIHNLLDDMENLDVEMVRQVLTPLGDKLDLVAGPQMAIQPRNVPAADLLRIIQYTRPLCEVVVLDIPCTYDDLYFETLAAADIQVLVLEQKLPAVRAMQMVRSSLGRTRSDAGKQFLVVNRYEARKPGFSAEDLAKHFQVLQVRTIANDYTGVSAAMDVGKPLGQVVPGSPALRDIKALLASLLELKEQPAPAVPAAGFKRMLRAFGLS